MRRALAFPPIHLKEAAMKLWTIPAAALLLSSLAPAANAQTAEVVAGKRLAEKVCVECHRIAPDAPATDPGAKAPSFVDVARMASTTELSLKVFLRSSHRNMPNLILSPEEIDQIAAYILSLAQK
jgi:mono/diheme cytochrome c family protein